jgi:predicted RNA binding protein YcfA (HicA-like mRNA interferase family)
MHAARIILERRDPSHFRWDELLHPRTRIGEFTESGSAESRLPAMTSKKLHKMLIKAGFTHVSTRGSHAVYLPPGGGRKVVVPMHGNRSIPRGTLRNILGTAGAIA